MPTPTPTKKARTPKGKKEESPARKEEEEEEAAVKKEEGEGVESGRRLEGRHGSEWWV